MYPGFLFVFTLMSGTRSEEPVCASTGEEKIRRWRRSVRVGCISAAWLVLVLWVYVEVWVYRGES